MRTDLRRVFSKGRCALAVSILIGFVALAIFGSSLPSASAEPRAELSLSTSHFPCPVGFSPGIPAYDPVNRDIYVPNTNSGNITLVTASCRQVASIGSPTLPIMAGPSAAVYDPADHYVYVTDSYYGYVYVIKGTGLKYTFTSLSCPQDPIYDAAIGDIVVGSDCGTPTLHVLNGTTIVKSVTRGVLTDPRSGDYDPSSGTLLIAYPDLHKVSIYDASTFKPIGHVSVGTTRDPVAIAYDASDHLDYVADFDGNSVSVISSAGTGALDATLRNIPSPVDIAYSPVTDEIYVATSGHAKMTIISGLTISHHTLPVPTASPAGLVYVSANGDMYVTDSANSQLDKV